MYVVHKIFLKSMLQRRMKIIIQKYLVKTKEDKINKNATYFKIGFDVKMRTSRETFSNRKRMGRAKLIFHELINRIFGEKSRENKGG